MFKALMRFLYRSFILSGYALYTNVHIEGLEYVPDPDDGPLVVVANHFSMFEVPLVAFKLPHKVAFFGAAELADGRFMRGAMQAFHEQVIPVRRGMGDRTAVRAAITHLKQGGWLSIFPEGGITAESIARAQQGLSTTGMVGHNSRLNAQLLPAQPGAAFLAVTARAKVLPIAFLGTEKIEANMSNWKRTDVQMRIGRPYGPLTVPDELRGREKRAYLNELGDEMMRAIACLMPPENRGVYGDKLENRHPPQTGETDDQ